MQIRNENVFKHSLAQGINLFLGAGFPIAAEGNGKLLPTGENLKDELLTFFNRKRPSNLNLAQLCQVLTSTHRNALIDFFKNRFTVTNATAPPLCLRR